jgi:photosystem II stability/assembly factor-like uncharacterized protein
MANPISKRFRKDVSRTLRPFLLVLLLAALHLPGKAQWNTAYHGASQNDPVNGMSFLTPAVGYIAFQNFVGFTQDSGRTIVANYVGNGNVNYNGYSVNLTFGFIIQGVHAFTKDSVFVYGNYGTEPTILFSSNQAQNWTVVYHIPFRPDAAVPNQGVTDMQFPGNGPVGFAVHNDAVLITTNRGQTWNTSLSALDGQLQKLSFPDGFHGYVSGGVSAYATVNGGSSWQALPTPSGQAWSVIQGANGVAGLFSFMTAQSGYLHTPADGSVYRTDDGAATWAKMNDPSIIPLYAQTLIFTNDSTGYAGSSPYSIWLTKDKGKTWEPTRGSTAYTDLGWPLGSLYFYNSQYGWAGGHDEFLLFTDNGALLTYPKAYFKVDTSGVAATGIVNLDNYSRPNYNYRWSVNGVQVSTSYNATYTHHSGVSSDTVVLIVSNGGYSDTARQIISIPNPVVTPPPTYTGWAPIVTGLADNLKDVRFWAPEGVVLGDHGLYYTTSGGVGAASWTKLVITTNSSDSLRLMHCHFEQMASQTAGQVYVCGTDTVQNQAVLFYFDMNSLTYTWKYIGAVNSDFHSIAISPGLDFATVVGDNGLILAHQISNAANTLEHQMNPQNLHEVEAIFATGQVTILGDSTLWTGDPRPNYYYFNTAGTYNIPATYRFTSIGYVNGIGDMGVTATTCFMPLFNAPVTQVNSSGIVFNRIGAAATNTAEFISTNRGIYRVYPSNFGIGSTDIEYQITSGMVSVNRIWWNEGYHSQSGYAVGPNGLLLATSNLGGPTVPYVNIGVGVVGGCTGQSVGLSGYSGTGNQCAWYLDGKLVSSNCSDNITIGAAGAHTLAYVSTNTTVGLSDTAVKAIYMNSPPAINLPVVVSDTILCKPSTILLQISNTQSGVLYSLKRKGDTSTFGSVAGNGSNVFLASAVLSQPGAYYISASGSGGACPGDFTDSFHILFGQIHSIPIAGSVNAAIGESVNYFQHSTNAQYYQWQFGPGASPSTSTDPNPQNITYSMPGQQSVTLIASNQSGCSDTVTAPGVFVYQPVSDSCLAVDIDNQGYYDEYYPQVNFAQAAPTKGGYLIAGSGQSNKYNSLQGSPYGPIPFGGAFLAKYATDGAFRWAMYSRQPDFGSQTNIKDIVNSVISDANGNIYMTGGATNESVFYFPNGDSIVLAKEHSNEERYNGFILKLDPNGNLLWRAILEDNTADYNGDVLAPVYGTRVALRASGDLVLTGGFGGNLEFFDNAGAGTGVFSFGSSQYPVTRNFIMNITAAGELGWYQYYNNIFYKDISQDGSGNIFLATTTGVMAIDAGGGIRWQTGLANGVPAAVTTDPSGNIYVTGAGACIDASCSITVTNPDASTVQVNYGKYFVLALKPNGMFDWAAGNRYSYYGSGLAIAYGNGRLHVLGNMSLIGFAPVTDSLLSRSGGISYTIDAADFFDAEYNAAGDLLEVVSSGTNPTSNWNITPGSIFFDNINNLVIGGNANVPSGGGVNIFGNSLTISGQDPFLLKGTGDFCGSPITFGPAVSDTGRPVITSVPPGNPQLGAQIVLSASISDSLGIPGASGSQPRLLIVADSLAVPAIKDTVWGQLVSGDSRNGTWTFTVQNSFVNSLTVGQPFRYFFIATDSAGNVGTYPDAMSCQSYSCDLSGSDNFVRRVVVNGVFADSVGPVIAYQGLVAAGYGVYRLDSVRISDSTGVNMITDPPQCYFRMGSTGPFSQQVGRVYPGGSANDARWSFVLSLAGAGLSFNPGDTLYYFVVAQDNDPLPNLGSNPSGATGTSVLHIAGPPEALSYLVLGGVETAPDAATLHGVDLTIVPNPNNGHFSYWVNGSVNGTAQVSVRSIDGRLVFNQQIGMMGTSYVGNVACTLAPGMYYLEIDTDRGRLIKKFLVR